MIGFTPRCSSPNFHAIGWASTGKPSKIQWNQALLPRECPPAMRITQVHGPKWLPHLHFFILLDSQYSNDAREIYAFCCWFTVPLKFIQRWLCKQWSLAVSVLPSATPKREERLPSPLLSGMANNATSLSRKTFGFNFKVVKLYNKSSQ